MKTSNKILSTAFAAYLLFTAGNSAAILKEYKRAEASGKALITQLEKTSIHVLSVEGDNYIQASRGRKSSQTLGFWSPFDPETTPLRICGDTLYISGTSYGYVTLPDLKSFLRNGKPQPINEDKTPKNRSCIQHDRFSNPINFIPDRISGVSTATNAGGGESPSL